MTKDDIQERMLVIVAIQCCFRHSGQCIICETNSKYQFLKGDEIMIIILWDFTYNTLVG